MTIKYPNAIDDSTSLPPATGDDRVSNNANIAATEAIETELGILPSGPYVDVRTRLDILESRINNPLVPAPNVLNPFFISGTGVSIQTGDGDPNVLAIHPASAGSLYLRQDGSGDQILYAFGTDNVWHETSSSSAYFTAEVAVGNVTAGKAVLIFNNQIIPFSLSTLPSTVNIGGVAAVSANIGSAGAAIVNGPDASLPVLGNGYACAVGCKSDGTLCRVTDLTCVTGLNYLGYCDINGAVTIAPRQDVQYNVLDYGFVNDGITANDGAIDNLSNIITARESGIVYFPPGEYLFNNTIAALPPNIVFKGGDAGTAYSSNTSKLNFTGAGYFFNANSGQIFENLYFVGTKDSNFGSVVISNITNASPMVVTTVVPHTYNTNDHINIFYSKGNTAANNDVSTPWTITKINSTSFSLNGSTGNGTYTNAPISIIGATNATPIVIQTSGAHGFRSEQRINISAVGGNTAANGDWQIRVVDSTHFSLWYNSYLGISPAVGSGNYTSGGQALSGAVALSNSNVPLIGLNIGVVNGDSLGVVTVRGCTFDSFKWQISVDGGELIYIEKCNFGTENGGIVLEMFSDYSTHSCFAIRIGSFDETIPQDANVVFVDQCQFINSYRSMYHHDGINHTVSRCNFEQPVMATLSGGAATVVYEKCENDGTAVDAIQFISDTTGGTAAFNFTVRDCFVSGNKALVNINTGVGYPVALYGLAVINNTWNGVNTLAQGGIYYAPPAVFEGNVYTNMGTNPIFDGGTTSPNGQPGTTINHYQYPTASLDIRYSPSSTVFPAVRIADTSSYVFSDKKWFSTTNILGGGFQEFNDVLSTNTGTSAARDGKGLGWIYLVANASSTQIGPTDVPSTFTGGNITMIVTASNIADTSQVSRWIIKQKFYKNGGAVLIGSMPDEELIDDNIGGLAEPTMSFIGTYPSTPIQVVCNVGSHSTLNISWAVRFQVDSVSE